MQEKERRERKSKEKERKAQKEQRDKKEKSAQQEKDKEHNRQKDREHELRDSEQDAEDTLEEEVIGCIPGEWAWTEAQDADTQVTHYFK